MTEKSELQELIEATNRNTAATRSIAIFLFGIIPWLVAAAAFLFVGTIVSITSYGGSLISGVGILLIPIGLIVTLVRAFKELRLSK